MKKLVPVLIVAVIVGGLWLFASERRGPAGTAEVVSRLDSVTKSPGGVSGIDGQDEPSQGVELDSNGSSTAPIPLNITEQDDVQIKPAAEAYDSADSALAAVLKGSKDYDDSILEQFTEPSSNCTWCPAFYGTVREMAVNSETPQDQKSYLAEILAISGRVENVETLAEAVKNAKTPDDADMYAQALELSLGKDDVTQYLGDQMASTNETLREAAVAAVTNQGSKLAVELLIKNTVARGDPDGYYSQGTGIGEAIPNEETMPIFHEMVQKRDPYSHLGVKALLNGGTEGLNLVFDELENSKDPEADRQMLKDAIDHVSFDDELDAELKNRIANPKQPIVVDFAKQISQEFSESSDELAVGSEEPNMSMADQEQ